MPTPEEAKAELLRRAAFRELQRRQSQRAGFRITDPNDVSAIITSPITSRPVSVPENAPVLKEVSNALARGGLHGAAAVSGTLATLAQAGLASPPPASILSPFGGVSVAEMDKQRAMSKEVAKDLKSAAKILYDEADFESLRPRMKGIPGYIINTTFETLPLMAASTVAGVVTSGAGAFLIAAMAEGESAYQEAIRAGASEQTAQISRLVVGTINGAIEKLQIDSILKLGKGAGKEAILNLVAAARERALGKLAKEAGKIELKHIGLAVSEGLQEALQEGVSTGVAAVRGDKITLGQAASRIGQAGLGGATAGYMMTGLSAPIQVALSKSGLTTPMVEAGVATVLDEAPVAPPVGESVTTEPTVTEPPVTSIVPPTEPIQPATTSVKPARPLPPKRLKRQIHRLAKQGNLSEIEYRDRVKQITGLDSTKSMSRSGLEALKTQFEYDYGKLGGETPVTVAGKDTTMEAVLNEAATTVNALPQRGRLLKPKGTLTEIGSWIAGTKNDPIYMLTKILDGGDENGIYSKALNTTFQHGRAVEADYKQSVRNRMQELLASRGITEDDLTTMSRAANPRLALIEWLAPKTESLPTVINGKTYKLTWGGLLDFYLASSQEAGRKHLLNDGLYIDGEFTGKMSEADIDALRAKFEANPKAMGVATTIREIGEQMWKPGLNRVSQEVGGKQIATEPDWWHLETWRGATIAGKKLPYRVSFIENQGMFNPRTTPKGPLVLRDAFTRFDTINDGTAEYIALAQPLQVARTLINDQALSKTLNAKGYGRVFDTLAELFNRIEGSSRGAGNELGPLKGLRQRAYSAIVQYAPHIWTAQTTSAINYGAYVSPKYMVHALDGFKPGNVKEMLAEDPIAHDRFYSGRSSLELGEALESGATYRHLTDKSIHTHKASIAVRYMDSIALAGGREIAKAELVDVRAGTATGRTAKGWAGLDLSKNDDALIRERSQFLWQHTQPSWDRFNRSWLTSHPSQLLRTAFPFRSYHEKVLAMWKDAWSDYRNGNTSLTEFRHRAAYPLASYAINFTIKAAVIAAMSRKLKKPWEYFIDLVSGPISVFPVLGDVLQFSVTRFVRALKHQPQWQSDDAAIESFVVGLTNETLNLVPTMAQAAGEYASGDAEKAKKTAQRGFDQALVPILISQGVPAYTLKRIYKGWVEPSEKPEEKPMKPIVRRPLRRKQK